MTVRDFIPGDRELYYTLSKGFYSGEATLHPANMEYIRRTFDECVKPGGSPYARAVLMEEDGKPAGFALFSFTWSNESGGFAALMEELFVLPEYRGLRIGTQFMDWLLEEYRDATRLRLEVCHSNDGARRLYQRYGFELLDYEQMVRDKDRVAK